MAFPSLKPALILLQAKNAVTLQPWTPTPGPVTKGHANGAYGDGAPIPKPYTVDPVTGARAQIQLTGGEIVTADLVVYALSEHAPSKPPPGSRWPRLLWQGDRYRVLGLCNTDGLSHGPGTCGIVCVLDNGGGA